MCLRVLLAILLWYSRTLQPLSLDHCYGAGRQTQFPLFQEIYTVGEANHLAYASQSHLTPAGLLSGLFSISYVGLQNSKRAAWWEWGGGAAAAAATAVLPWLWCECLLPAALAVSPQSTQSQHIWWHSRNARQRSAPFGGHPYCKTARVFVERHHQCLCKALSQSEAFIVSVKEHTTKFELLLLLGVLRILKCNKIKKKKVYLK